MQKLENLQIRWSTAPFFFLLLVSIFKSKQNTHRILCNIYDQIDVNCSLVLQLQPEISILMSYPAC